MSGQIEDGRSPRPPAIARSEWRHTTDGEVRRWPNRADYEEWYRALGEIEPDVPFAEAYHVHGPIVEDWMARGQTSCRFASVLARRSEEASWHTFTVTSELEDADLADILDRVLRESVESSELVQILFPGVNSAEELCGLVRNLTQSPGNWYWEEMEGDEDEICVGLRWVLPSKQHVAWIVGFGPFDFLPFTRRAPITTLAVRTSEIKRTKYELSDLGTIPVHLADVDDLLPNQETRNKLTEATVAAKKKYLDGEHVSAARARVTFRIPRTHAALLTPTE